MSIIWQSAQGAVPGAVMYPLGGALVAWFLGRPLLKRTVGGVRHLVYEILGLAHRHVQAQERLADAHQQQAEHLATIAARLAPPTTGKSGP